MLHHARHRLGLIWAQAHPASTPAHRAPRLFELSMAGLAMAGLAMIDPEKGVPWRVSRNGVMGTIKKTLFFFRELRAYDVAGL